MSGSHGLEPELLRYIAASACHHGRGRGVGVPLPLISYGGTAMMTVLIGFGLLMNVYIHRDMQISRYGDDHGS